MKNDETEETRSFWDRIADDWDTQVGENGDSNRILNSDPVLWQFAGDVKGLTVLDAGCGTGYLSRKLHDRGAHVIGVDYHWSSPYFQRRKRVDPPWGHFTSEFIWFHRPLSDYWEAFAGAGFEVADFEEPRIAESRYHLAGNQRRLNNSKTRPYSVAFKLKKKRNDQIAQAAH